MSIIDDAYRRKSISDNMRKKWEKYNILTLKILLYFYDMGFLPSVPVKRMSLDDLTDWLFFGPYDSPEHQDGSEYLYEKIIQE